MQASNAVTPPRAVSPRQQQAAPPGAGNAGPSQPLLYQACRDGDVATVKRLLAAGSIAVNAIDPDTRLTPLMLAARHGHDDVALVLMKGPQGADLQLQNSRGDSALSLAAGAGKDDVIELLLLKKAQPDQANHGGRTPLAEAAAGGHLTTAGLLIASGAQVNAGAGTGEPALVVAAQHGDGALVELLLEKKAGVDVMDRHGWTAFNHAASMGHDALTQRLRGDNAAQPAAPLPPMPSAFTVQPHDAISAGTAAPVGAQTAGEETPTTTTARTPNAPATPAALVVSGASGTSGTSGTSTPSAIPAIIPAPLAAITTATSTTSTATTTTATVSVTAPAYVTPAVPPSAASPSIGQSLPPLPTLPAWRNTLQASDPKACKALLDAVGNAAGIDAWLRQAAAGGHLVAVRLLLEAGANPNGFDDVEGKRGGIPGYRDGKLPKGGGLLREYRHYPDDKGAWNPYAEKAWADSLALTRAVRNGHAAIVQSLLAAGARVDRGNFCQQLLLRAIGDGHAGIAQMLLEARRKAPETGPDDCSAKDMEMALDHAIRAGNNLLLQALLDTEQGRTAACDSCDLLGHAAGKDNLVAVKMLLAAGADPQSYRSGPFITIAVERGNRDIVQAFLEGGFDLSQDNYAHVDREAKDPLMAAVRRGDADMLALLIAWGNRKRSQFRTIFCPYRINRLFSDACTRNSVAVAQLLLDAGADPDYDNSHLDERAFYRAAGAGQADIVALLLKRGAKVNEPSPVTSIHSNARKTALILAAGYKRHAWFPEEGGDSAKTVSLLLQAGASCNVWDKEGYSALMHAAMSGNTETVRLLLKAGADRNDRSGWGRKTALEWARENKHAETEELLRTLNGSSS